MTGTKQQIQEAQRTQRRINTKKPTWRHKLFKKQKTKNKDKILNEA
jgi:hypothetical protein